MDEFNRGFGKVIWFNVCVRHGQEENSCTECFPMLNYKRDSQSEIVFEIGDKWRDEGKEGLDSADR